MKEIVVINGSGGVGKDTFVQFCGEYTSIMNISSVDKVKEAAKVLAGWNGEKDEKSRKFLSDLKELGIEYNDAPFKYISNMAEEFKNSDKQIMFVHIRECEEIEKKLRKTRKDIKLIKGKDSEYNSGISVVPSYLAKGLEFDCVIISNANEEKYTYSSLDIKLLYVTITRAMSKLDIFYTGEITGLLKNIVL